MSTPAEQLKALQERKSAIHGIFAKLDRTLAAGNISLAEYRSYVEKNFGGRLEHELLRDLEAEERAINEGVAAERERPGRRFPAVAVGLIAVTLLFFAAVLLFTSGPQPTGFVTFEPRSLVTTPTAFVLTQSTAIPLNVTNTTELRISGSLTGGQVDVYLSFGGTRLLVYHDDASAPQYQVMTEKESYALGESISVTVLPSEAPATLWLTNGAGEKIPVTDGFVTSTAGAYTLDALINDSGTITKETTTLIVRDDADPANDVLRQSTTPTVTFTDACAETCEMTSTGDAPLVLDVQLSVGATLSINDITVTVPRKNLPPVQIAEAPNITVAAGESATIDLSRYFTDPENDTLTFDYMNAPGASMSVSGSLLTVTGITPSSSQSIIYASDLYSIAQSNLFTITVTPSTSNTTPAGNVTPNATAENATNLTTMNATNLTAPTNRTVPPVPVGAGENQTANMTASTTLDCSSPNPNERPVACLYQNVTEYFPDEEILLQNLDRVTVGRFTPIGNLIITGGVKEHSAASPGQRDYRIGYVDRDGNSIATIWIDSATGDLHLRGALHEENTNLQPPAGSYSLINRRSIFLAYGDQYAGDLYVRGNVIQYRKSIT